MHILSPIIETPLQVLIERIKDIKVLVIGSGTAGVTTAIELASRGVGPVAILEAGPLVLTEHVGSSPFARRDDLAPAIHDLVRYPTSWTSTQEHAGGVRRANNMAWSAVGGRTIFWGGCTPRFDAHDFADWPFGLDEFSPYYDRAEKLMRVSGSRAGSPHFFSGDEQDAIIGKLNRAGIPASRAPLGVDTSEGHNGNISHGFDSAIARLLRSGYLARLDTVASLQGKICLTADVVVARLHVEGGRVTAVDLHDQKTGQTSTVVVHCRVVLAGGAIQSTRLAMASGIDGGNGLVGRYLGDHLFVQGLMKLKEAPRDPALYVLVNPSEKDRYQIQLQGCFSETWYSPYHATVWLDPHPEGRYVLFYCFGSGSVEYNNRLHLDPGGKTGAGMRDYSVVYDRSALDLSLLEDMQACIPRVCEAMGAELVRMQVNEPGSALHEIGGLRMGTDAASSVTDEWGCFHHLNNLSVADSATWPYQGPANSYLSITAWSLRHADGLARRLAE